MDGEKFDNLIRQICTTRLTRVSALRGLVAGAVAALTGATLASDDTDATTVGALPTAAPDKSTTLRLGVATTQAQLAAEPSLGPVPFRTEWVRLNGGPETIQGFRAGAVDLASNAGMPPIQAHDIGVEARIVAISHNTAVNYIPTTRPGSDIRTAKDVVGKKIGFSQGHAQGVTILKWLKENGISYKDVELVPLPSAQFLTALQGKQVDLAPLTEPALTKYLEQYEKDGARALPTDVQDLLSLLWAPTSVLADDQKAGEVVVFPQLRGVVRTPGAGPREHRERRRIETDLLELEAAGEAARRVVMDEVVDVTEVVGAAMEVDRLRHQRGHQRGRALQLLA